MKTVQILLMGLSAVVLSACGKSVADFGPPRGMGNLVASEQADPNRDPINGIKCEVFDLSFFLIKRGCIERIPCSAGYPGPNCYREIPAWGSTQWQACRMLPDLDQRALPTSAKGDYPLSVGFIEFKQFDVSPRSYDSGFPHFPDDLKKTLQEYYALSCSGYIQAPETDAYDFVTVSDDGIRFSIDNQKVIVNEEAHPPTKDHGVIKLEKGLHPYKLEWSQYIRTEIALELYWKASTPVLTSSSRSTKYELVPADNLFRDQE